MFASTNKVLIATVLLLTGCADQKAKTLVADSRPRAEPAVSTTSLRGALQCLDDLMVKRRGATTDIVVGTLPDSTGKFGLSMRDMAIHAITSANIRSGAFRVIDQPKVIPAGIAAGQVPLDTVPSRVSPSSYNLSGSVVSASPALYNESFNLGVGVENSASGSLGLALIAQLGTVSTGMRLSRRGTNETLYSSQHEIVLQKSERGFDARVGFAGYGASAGVSFDEQDSSAKAIQTMVELHVLELLGKAASVKYWECLSRPAANPATQIAAKDAWDSEDTPERRAFMAKGLKTLGYDEAFEQALQRFQIDNNLNPTGRVSYDNFLVMQEVLATAQQAAENSEPAQSNITTRARTLNGKWRLEIGLARSAFVRCYYQADDGVIAQIYPNRFDKAVWLAANTTHFVPSTSTERKYAIGGRGPQFLCFSSKDDPSRLLPPKLQQPDFSDLRAQGIESLRDVINAYVPAVPGATASIFP